MVFTLWLSIIAARLELGGWQSFRRCDCFHGLHHAAPLSLGDNLAKERLAEKSNRPLVTPF
jgi:hypothetical protein